MVNDFISLIYPHLCLSCQKPMVKHEQVLCTYCRYHLPKTQYHKKKENPVSKLFWGRVPIEYATSYYRFSKGGKVQRLMHLLKYMGHTEIGETVGQYFGSELKESELNDQVDCIVPVPLHPKKRKRRGFNQSEEFGKGISEKMEKEQITGILQRAIFNPTQTKKSRFQRWKNVEGIFKVNDSQPLEGKHVLLVDDVVSTGSTLEACAHTLQQIDGVKVSIATMACAERL